MPRRTENLYSMARGRVRASMNKYNLFNLYKKSTVRYTGMSLYQQKWRAKQETRAYHGEHLTESRWKTLFSPNLESVAQLDASLKGVDVAPTPMSLQTYAVLEKRLEFALFRAMFASSIRQAREFIKHGHVKVNGVTIKHASFPLKSGDVFSVTPDKVMLAMGKVKPNVEKAAKIDNRQIAAWNKYVAAARASPKDVWDMKQAKPESLNPIAKASFKTSAEAIKDINKLIELRILQQQRQMSRGTILAKILDTSRAKISDSNTETKTLDASEAKIADSNAGAKSEDGEIDESIFSSIVSDSKSDMAKCLAAYEILKKANHSLIGSHTVDQCETYLSTKSTEFGTPDEAKVAAKVRKILNEIVTLQMEVIRIKGEKLKLPEDLKSLPFDPQFGKKFKTHAPLNIDAVKEDETTAAVSLPWQKGLHGRQDPLKPYFTPWAPRPFLGTFAILPHHIEVSFETCHAIYLNDPVARPGHSEVITPFPDHVHERAYMYYVRNGL